MIKCYFVDVKSIRSSIPKSKFNKAEIDRLADAILAADGLLHPLILQQTAVEKYTVIEGHREYYAAVRAKEKDIKKAEMVNAFIIDNNLHSSAIDQLDLLNRSQPPIEIPDPGTDTHSLTDLVAESIDRLLPEITAAISSQLQPIVSQLVNHQQILDDIKLALANKPTNERVPKDKEITEPVSKVDPIAPEVKPVIEPKPKLDRQNKSKPVENLGADLPEPKPPKTTKIASKSSRKTQPAAKISASIPVAIEPETQIADTIPVLKTTKYIETKQAATGDALDLDKSTVALNLINSLSKDDLMLKMERSGVKITRELVESMILKRGTQPAQKFDTWDDLIVLKIKGLTPAKIQDIIKKLK